MYFDNLSQVSAAPVYKTVLKSTLDSSGGRPATFHYFDAFPGASCPGPMLLVGRVGADLLKKVKDGGAHLKASGRCAKQPNGVKVHFRVKSGSVDELHLNRVFKTILLPFQAVIVGQLDGDEGSDDAGGDVGAAVVAGATNAPAASAAPPVVNAPAAAGVGDALKAAVVGRLKALNARYQSALSPFLHEAERQELGATAAQVARKVKDGAWPEAGRLLQEWSGQLDRAERLLQAGPALQNEELALEAQCRELYPAVQKAIDEAVKEGAGTSKKDAVLLGELRATLEERQAAKKPFVFLRALRDARATLQEVAERTRLRQECKAILGPLVKDIAEARKNDMTAGDDRALLERTAQEIQPDKASEPSQLLEILKKAKTTVEGVRGRTAERERRAAECRRQLAEREGEVVEAFKKAYERKGALLDAAWRNAEDAIAAGRFEDAERETAALPKLVAEVGQATAAADGVMALWEKETAGRREKEREEGEKEIEDAKSERIRKAHAELKAAHEKQFGKPKGRKKPSQKDLKARKEAADKLKAARAGAEAEANAEAEEALAALRKNLEAWKDTAEEFAGALLDDFSPAEVESALRTLGLGALKAAVQELGVKALRRLLDDVGVDGLQPLLAVLPPAALKGALEHLDGKMLGAMTKEFGAEGFKALHKQLGARKLGALGGAFEPRALALLTEAVKLPKLDELAAKIDAGHLADLYAEVGDRVTSLLDALGPSELGSLCAAPGVGPQRLGAVLKAVGPGALKTICANAKLNSLETLFGNADFEFTLTKLLPLTGDDPDALAALLRLTTAADLQEMLTTARQLAIPLGDLKTHLAAHPNANGKAYAAAHCDAVQNGAKTKGTGYDLNAELDNAKTEFLYGQKRLEFKYADFFQTRQEKAEGGGTEEYNVYFLDAAGNRLAGDPHWVIHIHSGGKQSHLKQYATKDKQRFYLDDKTGAKVSIPKFDVQTKIVEACLRLSPRK